jgi:hypothetical protein
MLLVALQSLALQPLLFALVATSTETATSSATPPILIGHVLAGGTYNPNAGGAYLGIRYHNVYGRSDSPILDNLYVDAGFEVLGSASVRPAVYLEWSPLAILKLRFQYELWAWTGAHLGLGHGLEFDGEDAPFDRATLSAREGEEEPGIGHRFVFMPTVQLKIWRIVLVDNFELAGWFVHGGGAGRYWYDSIDDNLIRKGAFDGTIKNQLIGGMLVWDGEGDAQILIAATYDYVRTFSAGIPRHRVGGLAAITPWHELFGISKPTLLVLAGANVIDRNRDDQFYLIGALRLEYNFL